MGWGGGEYLWCSFNELQLIPVTSKPLSEMRDRDTWFTPTTVQCSSRPQLAPCFFFFGSGVSRGVRLQSFTLLHWSAFKLWELFCMCVQQRVRGYGIKEWHYLLCISLQQKIWLCVCLWERGGMKAALNTVLLSPTAPPLLQTSTVISLLYAARETG